jgi:hypothetical protein
MALALTNIGCVEATMKDFDSGVRLLTPVGVARRSSVGPLSLVSTSRSL